MAKQSKHMRGFVMLAEWLVHGDHGDAMTAPAAEHGSGGIVVFAERGCGRPVETARDASIPGLSHACLEIIRTTF